VSYKTFNDAADEARGGDLIAKPSRDLDVLSGNVCGECKYFSAHEGQRLISSQKFMAKLVKEYGWKPHHLGSPTADLGDCGAYRSGSSGDDTMLTGKLHAACTQYRRK